LRFALNFGSNAVSQQPTFRADAVEKGKNKPIEFFACAAAETDFS